ncbi:hypothetical protein ETR_21312 [Erwinia tracheiphila PSU-1]|nr:hypothetical protein ETR_21312 [Erwinia tracheiphila PSU-1]
MADKKVDSARALIAGGWRISLVSHCLRISRAQLHAMARRSKNWQDRRRKRKPDNTEALGRIHAVDLRCSASGKLPCQQPRRLTIQNNKLAAGNDTGHLNLASPAMPQSDLLT